VKGKLFKKLVKSSKEGFTLIEIIAVLVVLGILAAVAVPKYLDIQDSARVKAAQGAIAEIKGRCSSEYARLLLDSNGNANAATVAAIVTAVGAIPDVGADFVVGVNGAGSTITISVSAVQGTVLGSNVTGVWTLPQ